MHDSNIEDLVTSRKYEPEELIDGPFKDVRLEPQKSPEVTTEDLVYEDTMPVYISMPRAAWKYVFDISNENKAGLSKTVSKLLFEFITIRINIDGIINSEIAKEALNDKNLKEFDKDEDVNGSEQLKSLIDKFSKITKNIEKLKEKKDKGDIQ